MKISKIPRINSRLPFKFYTNAFIMPINYMCSCLHYLQAGAALDHGRRRRKRGNARLLTTRPLVGLCPPSNQ